MDLRINHSETDEISNNLVAVERAMLESARKRHEMQDSPDYPSVIHV